jgi:hypothetical protein
VPARVLAAPEGVRAAVVFANLEQVTEDLAAGSLIVTSDTRIRARRLPMKPSD